MISLISPALSIVVPRGLAVYEALPQPRELTSRSRRRAGCRSRPRIAEQFFVGHLFEHDALHERAA